MLGFIVNVEDLLLALCVKVAKLLTGRSVGRLLEVRAETAPCVVGLSRNAVLLVDGLGTLGGLVLAVEVLQRLGETAADTMLLVSLDGTLYDLITQDVAMSQVFGDDTGAWLLFLRDVAIVNRGAGGLGAGDLVERLG
ncbi:hypothetical protein Tdes44962_MAKER09459 [Teratosphaeria destructans]|uniref:Uncharacterized protein n=1 Tax=Teratosphaeria destructans TaxID=418781 RepID=A0A9W7ST50_9PEZI|nr:hypothetical protein Tdes44962_MAKER09459 [Teratosphaeria destructans]